MFTRRGGGGVLYIIMYCCVLVYPIIFVVLIIARGDLAAAGACAIYLYGTFIIIYCKWYIQHQLLSRGTASSKSAKKR